MALIKCIKCGAMVSDKADACPNCGALVSTMIGNQEIPTSETTSTSVTSQPEAMSSEQDYFNSIRRDIELGNFESALEKSSILLTQCANPAKYVNLKTEIKEKWTRELKRQAESFEQDDDKKIAKEYYEKILSINPDDSVIKRRHNEIVKEEERIRAEQDEEKRQQKQEEMQERMNYAKKVLITVLVVGVLAVGAYFGFQFYQKSQIVDVPETVSSSEMKALFTSSDNIDAHKVALYSEVFTQGYTYAVENTRGMADADVDSDLVMENAAVKEIIAYMTELSKVASEENKYILNKNIDLLRKSLDKAEAYLKKGKESAERAHQRSIDDNLYVDGDKYVVITGKNLRLRYGPSTTADTYKWQDGTNRHPDYGEKLPYIDETDEWYCVLYNGEHLWVSKQFSHIY